MPESPEYENISVKLGLHVSGVVDDGVDHVLRDPQLLAHLANLNQIFSNKIEILKYLLFTIYSPDLSLQHCGRSC